MRAGTDLRAPRASPPLSCALAPTCELLVRLLPCHSHRFPDEAVAKVRKERGGSVMSVDFWEDGRHDGSDADGEDCHHYQRPDGASEHENATVTHRHCSDALKFGSAKTKQPSLKTFVALTDSRDAKCLVTELGSDDHRNRVCKRTTKALGQRDDGPTVGILRKNGTLDAPLRKLGGKSRTVPWECWHRQPETSPLAH